MKIETKELEKSQIELTVELPFDDLKSYFGLASERISKEMKIEGFRPGKVPFDVLKEKVGESVILEEAARIAIHKTIDKVMEEIKDKQPVGQPQINITKLALENPLEYKVVVALLPKIKLGNFKNLKVKETKEEVTDKEIDKLIETLRETRVKEVVTEREAKDGDKLLVDLDMFLDKVPVEAGQAKGVAVILGKDYVVPGFDKELIGLKKGETKRFSLLYPKDHHMANLAGKMVEIKAKVNEVYSREFSELNDEFAAGFGLKNMEDMKTNIRKSLEEEKRQKNTQRMEIEILDKVIEKTEFGDIPETLIDQEARTMLSELEHNVQSQGGKFDDYLASMKKTREQLALDLIPDAIKRVKSALVIREIALVENIKATEEEVKKRQEELILQYKGYEKVEERVKEPSYKAYLENILVNKKVVDKLKDWNVEK